MSKATFWSRGEFIGYAEVIDGQLVTSPSLGIRLEDVNVIQPGTFRTLTPADGDLYLLGLTSTFRSPYLSAVVEAD